MQNKFYFLLLLGCALVQPTAGQINFLGKPGVMTTPSASWEEDRQLGISFSYIPREYSGTIMQTRTVPLEKNTLNFYNARVTITSFMEAYLSVAYRPLIAEKIGVGDRQLDFRFRLLKEKKYLPSLVLGWTPPGSVSPVMAHDYLAATKNIKSSVGNFRITTGYGSPWVFPKNRDYKGVWDYLRVEEKSFFNKADYLSGFFGSITYSPVDFGGVMIEYNTNTVNAGAYLILWDWLHFQGYAFEGKKAAFQIAGHFPLDFSPFALRKHEKSLE